MQFWQLVFSFLSLALGSPQHLTATAVVEDADGNARIECWQFKTPFYKYPTTGMAVHLGDVSNVTYVALPPRSGEGIHKPPHPMLFVLLSGLAHVTLPDGDDEAWIMEGVNGLLVAADVAGVGHYTGYPSDKTTIALQVPFKDGIIPEHDVMHSGACKSASQVVSDGSEAGFFDVEEREELFRKCRNTKTERERLKTIREYNKTILYGDPNDPTPRETLNMRNLDLDVSYVGKVELKPRPKRPPRLMRWQHPPGDPLIDYTQLPQGWSMHDDDLDPEDIDGQIERCHERIQDNILPHIFQQRLLEYEARREYRENMSANEPSGLSWNVYQRISCLQLIGEGLLAKGDPEEKIPTVQALLRAYRTQELDWTPGLVTYWRKGVQLCQPRPFNWDEYEAIVDARGDCWSFWVEGLEGPGHALCYPQVIVPRSLAHHSLNFVRLAVRIPGVYTWAELDFLWDTGSQMMGVFQADLNTILGPFADINAPAGRFNCVPSVGEITVSGFNGLTPPIQMIMIEFTILDSNRKRMTAWSRVPCMVSPGMQGMGPGNGHRLDGPFLRSLLYIGTEPDNNLDRDVIFSTCKTMPQVHTMDLAANPRVGYTYPTGFLGPATTPYVHIMPPQPGVQPALPPAAMPPVKAMPAKAQGAPP